MSLVDEIEKILIEHSEGLSAREIGRLLGYTRGTINSVLYSNLNIFSKDNSYVPIWRNINSSTSYSPLSNIINDPVMCKLQNIDNADIYSWEEFEDLADWDIVVSHSELKPELLYETNDGRIIACDSKSEIKMLKYLEDNNLVQAIGGQSLRIEYDTVFQNDCSYFPDIVVLLNDNHIAIIEVKAASAMDCHQNIEKYDALKLFCEDNGYVYMMIDPAENFITYEEIKNMPVRQGLIDLFNDWNEHINDNPAQNYIHFDDSFVDSQYLLYGNGLTKKEFKLQFHSMIIFHRWYNIFKNGFLVYSCPIKMNYQHEVIEIKTGYDF